MADEARLERIERKVDEMGQTLVILARVEERMVTLFNGMEVVKKTQADHGNRIVTLEKSDGTNGQMLRFAERVFWIVVSAGVAFAFTAMRGSA